MKVPSLYTLLFLGTALLVLMLFFVAKVLGLEHLMTVEAWSPISSPTAALVSVGIMASDLALPVPSSLVMTANGRLFGLLGGSLVSLLGHIAGALVALGLGRLGRRSLDRRLTAEERRRAERMLERWGVLALALSRPVPVLAESVALVAASMGMGAGRYGLGILAGALPLCVLYAMAGASARGGISGLVVFAAVLAVSGALWGWMRLRAANAA